MVRGKVSMRDQADLRREKEWFYSRLAARCIRALERNNFAACYVANLDEARARVLEMIPEGALVGIGDSMTLFRTGVVDEIEGKGSHQVINPFHEDEEGHDLVSGRERVAMMKQALNADVFLTGANAVTLDGKLLYEDGMGNRVAGVIFGPKKVIVVAGVNKIVKNVEEGMKRIREIAGPGNCIRHHVRHGLTELPCVASGICVDCKHPDRICNYTVIVEFQRRRGREPRINVVLVGEELGL